MPNEVMNHEPTNLGLAFGWRFGVSSCALSRRLQKCQGESGDANEGIRGTIATDAFYPTCRSH